MIDPEKWVLENFEGVKPQDIFIYRDESGTKYYCISFSFYSVYQDGFVYNYNMFATPSRKNNFIDLETTKKLVKLIEILNEYVEE